MSKLELIKRLESLVSFQTSCLKEGNWEDYDRAENQVTELERKILYWKENGEG